MDLARERSDDVATAREDEEGCGLRLLQRNRHREPERYRGAHSEAAAHTGNGTEVGAKAERCPRGVIAGINSDLGASGGLIFAQAERRDLATELAGPFDAQLVLTRDGWYLEIWCLAALRGFGTARRSFRFLKDEVAGRKYIGVARCSMGLSGDLPLRRGSGGV